MIHAYKAFRGPLATASGGYGHGAYDLTALPVTLPALPGRPRMCEYGRHACQRADLVHHLSEHIAEVEFHTWMYDNSKGVTCDDFRIVRLLVRWTPQVQRLFACDCAAAVLHLATDPRCATAIQTARLYALGHATLDDLNRARYTVNASLHTAYAVDYAANATADAVAYTAAAEAADESAAAAAYAAVKTAYTATDTAAYDATDAIACAAAGAYAAADTVAYITARDAMTQAQTENLFHWLDGERTVADVERELAA